MEKGRGGWVRPPPFANSFNNTEEFLVASNYRRSTEGKSQFPLGWGDAKSPSLRKERERLGHPPDYYGNGGCSGNQQLCPYGLSDFFGGFQHKRSFKDIAPITYQPGDFSNSQKFPNWPEPADLETP
jgi:hypothetical protein